MGLTDLPREIFDIIVFRDLEAEVAELYTRDPVNKRTSESYASSQRSLAALCRTCRQLRDMTEPVLYSVFIKEPSYTAITASIPDAQAKAVPNLRLRSFLRTIMERPALAIHVKGLALHNWQTGSHLHKIRASSFPYDAPPQRSETSHAARTQILDRSSQRIAENLLVKKVRGLLGREKSTPIDTLIPPTTRLQELYGATLVRHQFGPIREHLRFDLLRGLEDAEVALLLFLLPRLRHLSLELPNFQSRDGYVCSISHYFHYHRILEYQVNKCMNPLAYLESLHVTCTESPTRSAGYLLWPVAEFLRLPCLRKFAATMSTEGFGPIKIDHDRRSGICQIEDLELVHSRLNLDAFTQLVFLPNNLRRLELHQDYHYHYIAFDQALQALWSQRHCLQYFHWSYTRRQVYGRAHFVLARQESWRRSYAFLPRFENLKTLKLHCDALWDEEAEYSIPECQDHDLLHRVLPESIEHVTFWAMDDQHTHQLQYLVENAPSRFRDLRRLEVVPPPAPTGHDNMSVEHISDQEREDRSTRRDTLVATCRGNGISLATPQECDELWADYMANARHERDL